LVKVKRTFSISLKHLLVTFLLVLFFANSYAQKLPYSIKVIDDNGVSLRVITGNSDSLKFQRSVKSEYSKLFSKGYILAAVSSTTLDTLYKATILTGKLYKWGSFNIDQIPEDLLSKSGFNRQQFDNAQINVKELGKLFVNLIEEADRGGYPFASAKLDSVQIKEDIISAVVIFSLGKKIAYSKLSIGNTSFVKSIYLESYLNIKEGELYNGKELELISKRIDNLAFCKISTMPIVKFENKTCKIHLNISPVKSNKVDALVGLAPNQLNDGKMLATGYVNLDLHNLFKRGKRLTFNWQQFGVQSQTLNAKYEHTNLFSSPINIQGNFNLFKQDTSFIDRTFQINVGIDKAVYKVNLMSRFISSRLLSNTTLSDLNKLELIDFNAQYYGIEFVKNEFDYSINPTKGWSIRSGANIGTKNILNSSFVSSEYYDSLQTQSLQSNFSMVTDIAVPVTPIFVAYSKMELATISSNGELFNNDLYRLGGVNSLRGFNELEIYASSYMMLQLEARLLLSENSRLFGFADLALTDNKVLAYKDNFLGVGMGLLLDTPSGVIQLVYAVGKSSKQLLSLTESKIHVGYVARF